MTIFIAATFSWYGLIIGGAMVLCIALAWYLMKKRGYDSDIVFDVAIVCIPLAIIGARLYYIVFDIIGGNGTFKYWFSNLRFLGFDRNSEGKLYFEKLQGLAIFGGLIFAALGGILIALRMKKKEPAKRMTYIQMLDMFFILIILGQAIGRWGNFANQEAYGAATNITWFPYAVYIDAIGQYRQATFFYESFFNFIGFGVLLWLYFGKHKSYDGFNFSIYCIWYGIVRAVIEGMRSDSLMMGPLRVSQWLAVVLIVYGAANIAYHVFRAKRAKKKVFIFVDKDKLSTDYYGYEKTIMYITKNQADVAKNQTGTEQNIKPGSDEKSDAKVKHGNRGNKQQGADAQQSAAQNKKKDAAESSQAGDKQ